MFCLARSAEGLVGLPDMSEIRQFFPDVNNFEDTFKGSNSSKRFPSTMRVEVADVGKEGKYK
jgi:hypothetical protein